MLGNINNQIRPPVNDPIGHSGSTQIMLTDIWFRYFNYLYQSILAALQYGVSVPTITQVQRDADAKYSQQVLIKNSTANELQINFGGTWYNVTLTPA